MQCEPASAWQQESAEIGGAGVDEAIWRLVQFNEDKFPLHEQLAWFYKCGNTCICGIVYDSGGS